MDLQEVDGKSVAVSQSETVHLNKLFQMKDPSPPRPHMMGHTTDEAEA